MRWLLVLLLLPSCGRDLLDGTYRAEVKVMDLDTCEDPAELKVGDTFELDVEVLGDTVNISSPDAQLHDAGTQSPGAEASHPRPPFIGRFLSGTQDEVFIADTNFEVVKTIWSPDLEQGVSCESLVHLAVIRGVVEKPSRFRGQLRKTYEPKVEARNCSRDCVVQLEFVAVKGE